MKTGLKEVRVFLNADVLLQLKAIPVTGRGGL
jgi:hypothetical protein